MTVDMVWDRSSLIVLIISSAIDSKAQSNGANPLISMSICLRTDDNSFNNSLGKIYFHVTNPML
jgi:hypothetical protein